MDLLISHEIFMCVGSGGTQWGMDCFQINFYTRWDQGQVHVLGIIIQLKSCVKVQLQLQVQVQATQAISPKELPL